MLSQVLKKYESSKKSTQRTTQILRQSIQKHIQQSTIKALKIQNHKVSKIHSNQQQIQNRLRRNSQLQSQLKVHLGGWLLLYQEISKTLKQAGDVVNYANYVQKQIQQINAELKRRVNKEKEKQELNSIEEMSNNEEVGEDKKVSQQKNEQTVQQNNIENKQTQEELNKAKNKILFDTTYEI